MNKKTKLKLNETLDKALEPPKRKDVRNLDKLLNQYTVEDTPKAEFKSLTVLPTHQPTDLPTYQSLSDKKQSIAPEKDFARVPNSIKRFVELGKLPNSSLAIYLYLYSLTRGAIQPKRSIRVNKAKLLAGANLRAEKALLKNLAHLKNIGLVKITIFNGDHSGNEYEIYVPEEIEANPPTYLPTKQPTYLITKDTPLPTVQKSVGRWGEDKENKQFSESVIHSFKDNKTNDDEPFGGINELKRIGTGKLNDWKELAELLIMEFEVAAARTKSVSNAPAFLTEHLRRRLIGKSEAPKPKTNKLSQIGKQQPSEQIEAYKAEPLSEEGRESTLKTFIGYIEKGQKDFLMSLQDSYTKEDWNWLLNKIAEDKE